MYAGQKWTENNATLRCPWTGFLSRRAQNRTKKTLKGYIRP